MRKRPSAMPVVELALAKALDQLALAHSAARLSDEDLAAEIAAATAMLEVLKGKSAGHAAEERTTRSTVRRSDADRRQNGS